MMDGFKPHIGKNVIETLTSGMYEDARFVFREYIQNAADQIDEAVELKILSSRDEGNILVDLDLERRRICVEDNATGIQSKNVLSFLGNIAASTKDSSTRKGFRGIGRLGGLGYCEKLVFETSFSGEAVKNRLTLDAVLLKKLIFDKTVKADASQIIGFITSLEKSEESEGSHYFKVILEGVTNDELLDIDHVKPYLSMIAPVPFDESFSFGVDIHNYFRAKNIFIDEYNVFLNETKTYKAYKEYILNTKGEKDENINIIRISFFEIYDFKNELIALGWYYVSDKLNYQLRPSNIERGIRLRKGNIGIGSELTLSRFFPQERQILNYIGEVHAISPAFIPNARRDYFNDNATCQFFEKKMIAFFPKLHDLTYDSSKLHSSLKKIQEYQVAVQTLQKDIKNDNLTKGQVELRKDEAKIKEKKANAAILVIRKVEKQVTQNKDLEIVYENIIGETNLDIPSLEKVISGEYKGSSTTELPQLTEKQKEVVLEIYDILRKDSNLTSKQTEQIIQKIAQHYS